MPELGLGKQTELQLLTSRHHHQESRVERAHAMIRALTFASLAVAAFGATFVVTRYWQAASPPGDQAAPPGMVWVPGGELTMGSDSPEAKLAEKPAHRVRVDGFWMDE